MLRSTTLRGVHVLLPPKSKKYIPAFKTEILSFQSFLNAECKVNLTLNLSVSPPIPKKWHLKFWLNVLIPQLRNPPFWRRPWRGCMLKTAVVPANPAVQPTVWPLCGLIGLKQSPSAGVDTPQLGTENFAVYLLSYAGLQSGWETYYAVYTRHLAAASPYVEFHDAPLFYYENFSVTFCHSLNKNEKNGIVPAFYHFHEWNVGCYET